MDAERESVIEELILLIIERELEIKKLKDKISQINQYIETYEEYIKRSS